MSRLSIRIREPPIVLISLLLSSALDFDIIIFIIFLLRNGFPFDPVGQQSNSILLEKVRKLHDLRSRAILILWLQFGPDGLCVCSLANITY